MTCYSGDRMKGYAAIGLYNPKSSDNIGSVMRTAYCFNAALVCFTAHRKYKHSRLDTAKASRHLPLIKVDELLTSIPFDCVPVAVEILPGAKSLHTYQHPERAFYIFGPEDGTLGSPITDGCRDVVQIPTQFCLNLAMAVSILLYDRSSKGAR